MPVQYLESAVSPFPPLQESSALPSDTHPAQHHQPPLRCPVWILPRLRLASDQPYSARQSCRFSGLLRTAPHSRPDSWPLRRHSSSLPPAIRLGLSVLPFPYGQSSQHPRFSDRARQARTAPVRAALQPLPHTGCNPCCLSSRQSRFRSAVNQCCSQRSCMPTDRR